MYLLNSFKNKIYNENIFNIENQIFSYPAARMSAGLDCAQKKQTKFHRRLGPWFHSLYRKLQGRIHQRFHRTSIRRGCLRLRCIARSLHFPRRQI